MTVKDTFGATSLRISGCTEDKRVLISLSEDTLSAEFGKESRSAAMLLEAAILKIKTTLQTLSGSLTTNTQ